MSRDLMAWLKAGKYLPDFMRDFHDQKDLFKTIHELVNKHEGTKAISWRDAHIYTIDVFLWFMAARGYALQRSRVDCEFGDIHQTIADQTKARSDVFASALLATRAPAQDAATDNGEKA